MKYQSLSSSQTYCGVGAPVGDAVGLFVGDPLGETVGAVGEPDGLAVGESVKVPSHISMVSSYPNSPPSAIKTPFLSILYVPTPYEQHMPSPKLSLIVKLQASFLSTHWLISV